MATSLKPTPVPTPSPFGQSLSTPKRNMSYAPMQSTIMTGPRLSDGNFYTQPQATYKAPQPQGQVLAWNDVKNNQSLNNQSLSTAGNGGGNPSSNNGGLSGQYTDLANQQNQDEVQAVNSLSDAEISALNDQMSTAGLSRSNMMQTIDEQTQQLSTQKAQQIADAQDQNVDEIAAGSATARAAQVKIRGILRALGQLSSSYATQALSEPINQFSQQKAEINQALTKRLGDIDSWYNTQLTTLAGAKRDVESQYSQLVDKIKSDIRFTESERTTALNQAKTSLQEKMLEIKASLSNTQQGVTDSLTSILGEYNGSINDDAISQAWMNTQPGVSNNYTKTASIYQDPRKKESLSDSWLGITS